MVDVYVEGLKYVEINTLCSDVSVVDLVMLLVTQHPYFSMGLGVVILLFIAFALLPYISYRCGK